MCPRPQRLVSSRVQMQAGWLQSQSTGRLHWPPRWSGVSYLTWDFLSSTLPLSFHIGTLFVTFRQLQIWSTPEASWPQRQESNAQSATAMAQWGKWNTWLPPGGHSEGRILHSPKEDVSVVALRAGKNEVRAACAMISCGLKNKLVSTNISSKKHSFL